MTHGEHTHRIDPVPGRRRFIRALLAVLLAVGFFLATFHSAEMLEMESVARDFAARIRPAPAMDAISIVTITDADYDTLFLGRSPLNPEVVARMLRALAAGKPRVIGIDIETSDSSFGQLRELADSIERAGVRLVWARDAIWCGSAGEGSRPPVPGCGSAHAEPVFAPLGVLGQTDGDGGGASGIVTTELDAHATVRFYRDRLPVGDGKYLQSFPSEVGRRYDTTRTAGTDTARRFISFHQEASNSFRMSAGQLLALAASPSGGTGALTDRIVLVGGTYRAARDEHHTPLGVMSGVDIQAQTIETELAGGGATVPSTFLLGTLQFVTGSLVVLLIFYLRPARAAAALVVALPVLSVLGSRLLTNSWLDGVLYFLPLLVLLVLHQLYEKANFYRELLLRAVYDEARGAPTEEESAASLVQGAHDVLAAAAARGIALGQRVPGRTDGPSAGPDADLPD